MYQKKSVILKIIFFSINFLFISNAYSTELTENKISNSIVRGKNLYDNGDISRSLPACSSCHGYGGASNISIYPKLANQHFAYIIKQLKDYQSGKNRNNSVMFTFSNMLTDQEIQDVAIYLSQQSSNPGIAKNKNLIMLGEKIYRSGISSKGIPSCAACHLANGAGIPNQYPRLSGQWSEYTEAQLIAYKSQERKNSVPMTSISSRMSDIEIKAVSDYIAGLH